MSRGRAVIRHARLSDAEAIARVHIASADEALAPLAREWPASNLELRTEQWAASLRVADRLDMVATISNDVVGFIAGGPPRKGVPASVEIYVLHVLPTHRRAGIASHLWDAACASLRGNNLAPLYLETLAELPCCTFYDARGGQVLTRTPGAFFGGDVTFLIYHWPSGKPHQRHQ